MRSLARVALAWPLLLFSTLDAQEPASKLIPLEPELVAAWTKAGGSVIWQGPHRETGGWILSPDGSDLDPAQALPTLTNLAVAVAPRGKLPIQGEPVRGDIEPHAVMVLPFPDRPFGLVIAGQTFTPNQCARIAANPFLTALKISGASISAEAIQALKPAKQLIRLNLPSTELKDGAVAALVVFPQLTVLNLQGARFRSDDLRVLATLRQLEELDLAETDSGVQALVYLQGLDRLKSLNLSGVNLEQSPARSLAALKSLTDLNLENSGLSDDGLQSFSSCEKLESLDLRGTQFTAAGLRDLRGLKNLHTLYLDSERVTDDVVKVLRVAGALPTLYTGTRVNYLDGWRPPRPAEFELFLTFAPVTAASLREIRGCQNLVGLLLDTARFAPEDFRLLSDLPHLRRLSLSGKLIDDRIVAALSKLTKLKQLAILGGDFSQTGLRNLAALSSLEELSIQYATFSGGSLRDLASLQQLQDLQLAQVRCSEAFWDGLETFSALQKLEVDSGTVTDAGLAQLSKLPELQVLQLNGTSVTPAGLRSLKGLRKFQLLILPPEFDWTAGLKVLREINLLPTLSIADGPEQTAVGSASEIVAWNFNYHNLTDDGLEALQDCTQLKVLQLSGCPVTDAGLRHLTRFPKLEVLDLSSTLLTGDGLKELGGLKRLTTLSLQYNRLLTDAAVPHLSKLKSLKSLEVFGTQISPGGIATLRQALPECEILAHDPDRVIIRSGPPPGYDNEPRGNRTSDSP